jgi:hypothetical protein
MESKTIDAIISKRPVGRPRKDAKTTIPKPKKESKGINESDASDDDKILNYIHSIVDKRLREKNIREKPATNFPVDGGAMVRYAPMLAPLALPILTGLMNIGTKYLTKKKEPSEEKSSPIRLSHLV